MMVKSHRGRPGPETALGTQDSPSSRPEHTELVRFQHLLLCPHTWPRPLLPPWCQFVATLPREARREQLQESQGTGGPPCIRQSPRDSSIEGA